MDLDCTVDGTMAHAQRIAILDALSATRHNLSETARQLRIGRTTLYRLMEAYQISLVKADRRQRGPAGVATSGRAEPRVRLVNGVWYLDRPNTRSLSD